MSFLILLFPKLRNDTSIKNKIKIMTIRHNNNYFIGRNIDEIEYPDKVKPVRKVTNVNLNNWLNKNQRSMNKKLSWVVNNLKEENSIEELATFKNLFDNNKFKSVAEAA